MKKITKVVCSTALIVGMLGPVPSWNSSSFFGFCDDKTYNYRRC